MATPKIKILFDVVSPFSYMGVWASQNLHPFNQCEITYVPILLGGLMNLCDLKPPIAVKNKARWIVNERLRWRALFNIPMTEENPPNFPPRTVNVQRALVFIQKYHPELLQKAASALFTSYWVDCKQITEADVVQSILSSAVGETIANEALEKAQTKEIKDGLIANTQEAFEAGAFGVPWFEVTNSKGETESFWGFDHLGQVAAFLGLEKPTHSGWKAMM